MIVFCLLRPALILKAAVPQQNFLGVLVDDSRSLQIADIDGRPRSAFVNDNLGADRPLLNALSKKFVLRFFRFSSTADRLQATSDLKYEGTTTRLGGALDRARDELAGLPLAGLVMVSDGADTSDAALDESIASLKARSIPVFTVGVGQERFAKDIQVTRVETPRAVLKGTSLVVNVVLTQTGYAGATVPLNVEDEGRIVGTQDVTLPPDGESATVRVRFTASDAGPRMFRISVPAQANEQVTQNNARTALIEVNDRREKILYFEGEPRFETEVHPARGRRRQEPAGRPPAAHRREQVLPPRRRQRRRARGRLSEDARRALRLSRADPGQRGSGLVLARPAPDDRRFRQQARRRAPHARRPALVCRRRLGGHAGRRSAAGDAGGAADRRTTSRSCRSGRRAAGRISPVTQIGADEAASEKRWLDFPPVTTVNPVHGVKPGATILLSALDNRKQDQVVLAFQRYGRGKALAMPIQDSWQWRMNAKIPVTDTTYATFWRRLGRWLVDDVPDKVMLTMTQDRVDPGQPMKLTAEVVDAQFTGVNDARVVATITSPKGTTTEVPLEWTVEHDGEYRSSVVPDEEGLYTIRVSASRDAKDLGSDTAYVRASAADSEYFDATMRAPLLKRIAEETGGRFYTPADAAHAAGSDQLQRARGDGRRRARPVGHAGDSPAPHRADRRRVGLPPRAGPDMTVGRSRRTSRPPFRRTCRGPATAGHCVRFAIALVVCCCVVRPHRPPPRTPSCS